MRRRIVAAIVGVTAVAVGGFALPLGVTVGPLYRDDQPTRLERAATAATLAVDLSAAPGDPVELPRSGSTATGYYDRSGRLVSGRGPRRADDVALEVLRTGRV